MKFFSSSLLAVLALALFVCASPAPSPSPDNEVAVRQADVSPNASILPLTLFAVFQILRLAVQGILPGIAAIVAGAGPEGQSPTAAVVPLLVDLATALDTATTQLAQVPPGAMGADDQIIANLINDILNDVNDALNKLVPKLGLDAILTPLDAALTGLLTSLTIPVLAPVLALVGALLVPIGGIVGGLLSALGLAGL
ncbi:hypothetical protein B0H19DRAFT_1070590 [Mycena capillaripes]|nr:hypothetical protein B0H19DRAFT_1070590 [Mycena capillaripes]